MPSIRKASATLVATTALLTLAACSSDSSSGPKPLTAAQLATHYDSLARALSSGPTQFDSSYGKDIAFFNGVIADGQLPSSVQLTVGGATQTWFGVFANFVENTDSIQFVIFWPNTQVSSFVGLIVEGGTIPTGAPGVGSQAGDFLSDSINTFNGTFAVAPGTCNLSAIADTSFLFGPFSTYAVAGETCTPATAVVTGSVISHQGDTTATAALQSLSFNQQTVNGVRLEVPILPPQHVVPRLRSLAAKQGGMVFFRRN